MGELGVNKNFRLFLGVICAKNLRERGISSATWRTLSSVYCSLLMINNYVLADLRLRFERAADDLSQLVKVDNNERYIECLVVVDQKMVNYHGEDAASQFALVVLNIVSDHDC